MNNFFTKKISLRDLFLNCKNEIYLDNYEEISLIKLDNINKDSLPTDLTMFKRDLYDNYAYKFAQNIKK